MCSRTQSGYKIALVVMESNCNQPEENASQMCASVQRAGERGAQAVLFPEASLTGYCPGHATELAIGIEHILVEKLRQAAKKSGIKVVAGIMERAGGRLYISQLVCGPEGSLQVYRKAHLGVREKEVFYAGDALKVFDAPMPFGIGICYDMHFPEAAAAMRAGGARLLLAPHASPVKAGPRLEVWARYMPARAYDNRVYVACCNACGSNGCGTVFSGGAAVYAPDGSVLAADFQKTRACWTLK